MATVGFCFDLRKHVRGLVAVTDVVAPL
jgi:hypothetical protein